MDQEMLAFRESLMQHLQKEANDQAQNLAVVTGSQYQVELEAKRAEMQTQMVEMDF